MNIKCMSRVLAGLAVAMATTACYRYVPAEIEATPPGTDVSLLVTRDGAQQAEVAGALDGGEPRVRGTVVGVEGDQLMLRVPVAQLQQGFITNRIDQAVGIPMGEIVSFQRRELDGVRTGLVIGGGAAVVAGLAVLILDPLRGNADRPGPDPDEAVFPIFSIPIGP